MKKKLALLLSAVMVVGMIPMTAFAVTTNEINKIVTGKADAPYAKGVAPVLTIKEKSLKEVSSAIFKLTLTNGEWSDDIEDADVATLTAAGASKVVTIEKLSDTQVIVTATSTDGADPAVPVVFGDTAKIEIPLVSTLKGEGDATVTIDPMESVVTSGTYKFANVVAGATTTTIEKANDLQEGGSEIKSIVVTETAAGSMKSGTIKLKLTNGFEFKKAPSVSVYPKAQVDEDPVTFTIDADDKSVAEAEITINSSAQAMTLSLNGAEIGFGDDVDADDDCELTISGANITKQTIKVGVARAYGVSVTAENKTLPTFVAGRIDSDNETLKVTFKEVIRGSWLDTRKTQITFPEGVKVVSYEETVKSGMDTDADDWTKAVPEKKADTSVITLDNKFTRSESAVKIEYKFVLSVDPSYTGDIAATFSGAGLEEDMQVVVATAIAPITVEAETNEVSIDYRNVAIGDFIIKETEAGNLKKGDTIYLGLEYLDFDGTPTVEVVEGDIKIDTVKVSGGVLKIKIKTASQKTPAVLKVTDNELFLGRNIPAGSYELSLVLGGDAATNAIFKNYDADPKATADKFDTDEIVVLEDFVEVVTAGRDQDDSTFTTQISVTIGADKLVAGKTEIALDVPAYISEGYTMLPVRAVTEALSGKAIVRWDDATKTVTITFGSRVISMTVGSKTMNINGVAVQMSKACEITDSRAFIPLRDLGYALGLNDSKINWDDATKTATLN